MIEEAQPAPPTVDALDRFDAHTEQLPDENLLDTANAAAEEAERRFVRGYYQLALPAIETAVKLMSRVLGKKAGPTLRALLLKAHILDGLGLAREALDLTRSVADAREAHPSLGPSHPDALVSRYLVAELLSNFGKNQEALDFARSVADAREAHPSLGPSHPHTLLSRC